VRTEFSTDEAEARQSFDPIRALPAQLADTDYAEVDHVLRRADAAGRSSHYADQELGNEAIQRLFEEDQGAVRRRIAGSVSRVAKEKECAVEHADELGNAAASATRRAVDRQLAARLRARSDASVYLEAERETFGQRNATLLEKGTERLTRASFLTHVRLELHRRELEGLLEEKARVKETLDRTLREDNATLASDGVSKARRTGLERRIATTQAARSTLDAEVAESDRALVDMTQRIDALQKDYRALLDGVSEELERKQAARAAAPAKPTDKAASKPAAPSPAPATEVIQPARAEPALTRPAAAEPAPAETPPTAPGPTPPAPNGDANPR
jgi:chromosome segregation ATPase